MSLQTIKDDVAKILSVALERPVSASENLLMGNPATWDSLKQVEIALLVEETFSIQLPPEKIAELSSQKKIVDYVSASR